nr:MAG TPA: hypothetical protein [Caudoviricetes sp.]
MYTSFMCARHQVGSYYHTLRQTLWRALIFREVVYPLSPLTVKVSNSVTV